MPTRSIDHEPAAARHTGLSAAREYPGRMTDPGDTLASDDGSDDLVSALEVIEDQPLAQRAAGYAALHDELARRLDAVAAPGAGGDGA